MNFIMFYTVIIYYNYVVFIDTVKIHSNLDE